MPTKALYAIRSDCVLIHSSLPAIPITDPPSITLSPDNADAVFVVARAVPPVSWFGVLSWYGIRQPRAAHIWPLRALLHLYLMIGTRHLALERDPEHLAAITDAPDHPYETLLGRGCHFAYFWSRIPEMLLLALDRVKEQHLPTVVSALLKAAHPDYRIDLSAPLFTAVQIMREHVLLDSKDPRRQKYPRLTDRRAGMIERALVKGLATQNMLTVIEQLPATSNKLLTAARHSALHIYRDDIEVLQRAPDTCMIEPEAPALPVFTPNPEPFAA